MAGARIIMNSEYFRIAQSGEKADGKYVISKDQARSFVNYVATREGVSINFDPLDLSTETAAKHATEKQIQTIGGLLREVPQAKDTFEYQDYIKKPTIGNASELIARAAELGYGRMYDKNALDPGEVRNFVHYVAKRPGAVREGQHGLFSSTPNLDLDKVADQIAEYKGHIWRNVISLRREDADKLGYNTQRPWKDTVLSQLDVIARSFNIAPGNLNWYAGMHDTGHHPHIHLMVFSSDPKEGHLKADGINKIKAGFSRIIFADERLHIYEHKDEIRNDIKQKADEILSHIQTDAANQFSRQELDAICGKLLHLSQDLKGRSGKMQFGWIKDLDLKKQVNSIMADLAKAPDIQKLYELYCEDHKNLQRMYRNDPKDPAPIVKDKEFQSIKNRIIREAVRLRDQIPEQQPPTVVPDDDPVQVLSEGIDDDGFTSEAESIPEGYGRDTSAENEQPLFDSVPDGEFAHALPDVSYESPHARASADPFSSMKPEDIVSMLENRATGISGDAEARYWLGEMYRYGLRVPQDSKKALMWFGLAAEKNHTMAKYELGEMYAGGIGTDPDVEKGNEYFRLAFEDFKRDADTANGVDVEQGSFPFEKLHNITKDIVYEEYLAGRMRLSGKGVEKDDQAAFNWFQAASWQGNTHSLYMLGKMYYDGKGTMQDYQRAAGCFSDAASKKDRYACYTLGRMYYRGIGVVQNYQVAINFFMAASKENVPYADYTFARMYEAGQGIPADKEKAGILFEKALEEFIEQDTQQPDTPTEYRIARMYLSGEGTEPNPGEAAVWLTKAAEKQHPQAQYELAGMYEAGNGIDKDESRAQELYATALSGFLQEETENPEAAREYRVARMYENGVGTGVNMTEAVRWYEKAAEAGHGHAAYHLGKLYLEGQNVSQDVFKALRWFEMNAREGNHQVEYQIGQILENGTDVPKNVPRAQIYYNLALNGFIESDCENPDAGTEFRIAQMFYKGRGTVQNYMAALQWFSLSASKGNTYALFQQARMFQNGEGVPKDEQQAQKLYAEAFQKFMDAEREGPTSELQYKIASMYESGLGVEKNTTAAKQWYSMPADNGNQFAAERLQQIQKYEMQTAISSVFSLFRAFSRMVGNGIEDSTTRRYRQDHKLMQKQRALKMAHGQLQEQEQTM